MTSLLTNHPSIDRRTCCGVRNGGISVFVIAGVGYWGEGNTWSPVRAGCPDLSHPVRPRRQLRSRLPPRTVSSLFPSSLLLARDRSLYNPTTHRMLGGFSAVLSWIILLLGRWNWEQYNCVDLLMREIIWWCSIGFAVNSFSAALTALSSFLPPLRVWCFPLLFGDLWDQVNVFMCCIKISCAPFFFNFMNKYKRLLRSLCS